MGPTDRLATSGDRLNPESEERHLREALYALNRAILSPDDEHGLDRLKRIRDDVWELGVDLYGWEG